MADAPEPLHAIVGNMWVPVWAIRPGSYTAVAPLASCMPLWLVLHSKNADFWKPAYASRDQLGATLGTSRATVGRQLKELREAHLLFDVDRDIEPKSRRHRPPARWALDPFAADIWRPKVEEALARVAEEDGHDGRWYQRAITSLDAFERRSRLLAQKIGEDMPFTPKPRKRKKRKRKKKGATAQIEPRAQNEPRGEVFTRVGSEAKRNGKPDPSASENGKREAGAGGLRQNHVRPKSSVDQTREPTNGKAPQGLPEGRGQK